MSQTTDKKSVSVIGLGPMGQATVKQLLHAGINVTVWNRTTSKADDMVALGAHKADTVAEALEANDVTIISLTHYDAMYDVLGQAIRSLSGKTIVNVSSDSPETARKAATWVTEHGATFLTGGFASQGDDIANELSYLFYSGPKELFETHKELLEPLGPQEYLGEDYGLSQLFYQGLLTLFHPILLSFQQATATVVAAGIDPDKFLPYAQKFMANQPAFFAWDLELSKQGGWNDIATLKMMDAGAQHVIDTSDEVGVSADITKAVQQYYRTALTISEETGQPTSTYQVIAGKP